MPSDVSLALSPHVLEHRLQQPTDDVIHSKTSLEEYMLQSSVRVNNERKAVLQQDRIALGARQALAFTPQRLAAQKPKKTEEAHQVGPAWLFPQNLISEESEQMELLQMV